MGRAIDGNCLSLKYVAEDRIRAQRARPCDAVTTVPVMCSLLFLFRTITFTSARRRRDLDQSQRSVMRAKRQSIP